MPSRAQYATAQPLLTNYSKALIPDQGFVAQKVLPWVDVPTEDFRFTVFDANTAFRAVAVPTGGVLGARAMGSPYTRINYGVSATTGRCEECAYETAVDLREPKQAAAMGFDALKAASLVVRSAVMIAHERAAAALLFSTTTFASYYTAVAAADRWNVDTSEPATQALLASRSIRRAASASFANAIYGCLVGAEVHDALRRNAAIVNRVQYTSKLEVGQVSDAEIAAYLGVKEYLVGGAIYDSGTSVGGLTGTDIWGKYALFYFRTPTPAREVASIGYCFGTEQFMSETYRDETIRSDVLRAREVCVQTVCNTAAGYLFSTVID